MMNHATLKRRFKYRKGGLLTPWKNLTEIEEGKPVEGDCQSWGWSSWIIAAGSVKGALKEMVTLKGIMWRVKSKYNWWFWPRHAVLQRDGKFTDSSSKDWRDDIGENTRYWPAGTVPAVIAAIAAVSIFRPEWIVKVLFLIGVL